MTASHAPEVVVMMGVSGSGKTTVGERLAQRLGWAFKDGDDLHPPGNVAKLRRGISLTDADRAPWLASVAAWIDGWARARVSGVIACSALKRAYRRTLAEGRPQVRFIYLEADPAVLQDRLAQRDHPFMLPSLLASQLADLEPPAAGEAIVVDAGQPVETQVESIVKVLAEAAQPSVKAS